MRRGVVLGIIKCEDKCNDCDVYRLKDPEILGDYDEGGTLLRFCPECGVMWPELMKILGYKKESLSHKQKKLIGTRVATEYKLDHKVMNGVVKDLKNVSKKGEFIDRFKTEVKLVFGLELDEIVSQGGL